MTISLNDEQATSLKAAAAVAGTTQMALIRESLRRQLLEILVNQGGRGPGASYQRAVSLKESGRSLRMIAQTLSAEGYVTAQGRPWMMVPVDRDQRFRAIVIAHSGHRDQGFRDRDQRFRSS